MFTAGLSVNKDINKSKEWLLKAAKQIFSKAWASLSQLEGNEISKEEVFRSQYEMAINEASSVAQFEIGKRFFIGNGVSKDVDKAVYWIEKSASQGYVYAQHVMGISYLYGNYTKKDISIAITWFDKASEQGYAESQWCIFLMTELKRME